MHGTGWARRSRSNADEHIQMNLMEISSRSRIFGKLYLDLMVGVAQLVERRIVVPVAEGSNPSTHPILSAARRMSEAETMS